MQQNNNLNNFTPLVDTIVDSMDNLKAEKITILDLRDLENSVTDFFVICQGKSNTQVNAISNAIEKNVREKLSDKPWHVEGRDNSEWVLMDYVNTVAHIFQPDKREFYDIESLWGDAKEIKIEASY